MYIYFFIGDIQSEMQREPRIKKQIQIEETSQRKGSIPVGKTTFNIAVQNKCILQYETLTFRNSHL